MADERTDDPGEAPRLIRVLGSAARPLMARLDPAAAAALVTADPRSLRRPIDAAVSAIACEALAARDASMSAASATFTLRFLVIHEELLRADEVLRSAGVTVARASQEEDVVNALLELARTYTHDPGAVLDAAIAAARGERWSSGESERALLRAKARVREGDDDAQRTPAFGVAALAESARYGALVEVRRLDTAARTPTGGVSLECGGGLVCLIDTVGGAPFFADSITALANVVVADVAGGGRGVRLQLERPDRTVIVEVVPLTVSSDAVAHALALLAERARAGR